MAKKPPLVPALPDPAVEAHIHQTFPPDRIALGLAVRAWLWQQVPQVAEGIRWALPYFHHQGPLLYLNPDPRMPGVIRLGWARGRELQDPANLLTSSGAAGANLTMIRYTDIATQDQLADPLLLDLLHQAVMLNELVPIGPFWGNRRTKHA